MKQTVAKNDWFSKWCIDGGLNYIQYAVYDRDGRPRRCYGGHLLVDGGYQKIGCFIPPQRVRVDSAAVYWCECVESTRKDVECVFGILKARFRILAKCIEYADCDGMSQYTHRFRSWVKRCGMVRKGLR